jgi:hypothetical protein
MSDKVELRNKLLSKLVKKASKLNESIKLFSKLDKKISLNQTGGNMHNIGIKLASIEHYAAGLQGRLGDLNALVGHYDAATNTILQTLQGLRLGEFSHLTDREYQNVQAIFTTPTSDNIRGFIKLLLTNKRDIQLVPIIVGGVNAEYDTTFQYIKITENLCRANGANRGTVVATRAGNLPLAINGADNRNLSPGDGTVTILSDVNKKDILTTLMQQVAIHSPAILT